MKLKHARLGWVKDEAILRALFWAVVGLYLALAMYLILAIIYNPERNGHYYACLKADYVEPESRLSVSVIVIILILSSMICLSIGMDLLCLWKLRHEEATIAENQRQHQLHLQDPQETPKMDQNEEALEKKEVLINARSLMATHGRKLAWMVEDNQDRKQAMTMEKVDCLQIETSNERLDQFKAVLNELPVRSTLLNTLFLVPYIIIMAALGNLGDDFSEEDKRYVMGLPFLILSM